MIYSEYLPDPKLSDFIQAYFEFFIPRETKEKNHLLVPEGCVYLVYFKSGSIDKNWCKVLGPHHGSILIPIFPGTRYWGIRFFPGSTEVFFKRKAIYLRNQNLDLKKLNNGLFKILFTKLNKVNSVLEVSSIFDEVLSSLITSNLMIDPNIQKAVRIIIKNNGQMKIKDILNEVNMEERTFRRKFKEKVGLTPKEFSKIRRVRYSIQKIISESNLNEIIYDSGYFDQSHFYRDSLKILGIKPTTFSERLKMIKHEKLIE